jgi:hypothetical protein
MQRRSARMFEFRRSPVLELTIFGDRHLVSQKPKLFLGASRDDGLRGGGVGVSKKDFRKNMIPME